MRITEAQLRRIIREAIIQELVQTSPGVYEDPETTVGYNPEAAQGYAFSAANTLMPLSNFDIYPAMKQYAEDLAGIRLHLSEASLSVESSEADPAVAQDAASRAKDIVKRILKDTKLSEKVQNILNLAHSHITSLELALDTTPSDVPRFVPDQDDESFWSAGQ